MCFKEGGRANALTCVSALPALGCRSEQDAVASCGLLPGTSPVVCNNFTEREGESVVALEVAPMYS